MHPPPPPRLPLSPHRAARLLLSHSIALFKKGDLEGALADMEAAAKLGVDDDATKSNHALILSAVGIARSKANDADGAAKYLREAAELKPTEKRCGPT